jgi:thiol-disulfide isomerase/thioredoxin
LKRTPFGKGIWQKNLVFIHFSAQNIENNLSVRYIWYLRGFNFSSIENIPVRKKKLNLFEMKHIYSLLLATLVGFSAFAQLPDGSIAPDFTATDIDGVEHNLYDLLDDGKKVIVDFSATWCGPCWSYAVGGALEEVYEQYGPNGTDEVRLFHIESDDATTMDDILGTGASTQGDWTSVINFPIIDDAANIFDDYQCTFYPTIFTICPNRILTQSGQGTAANHAAIFQANDCAAASLVNDPALLGYTGGTTACPGEPVNMSVNLMNLGVTNLQYCTIAVMEGGTELLSYDWSGDLDTYGIENVDLGTASFDSDTNFTIEITSGDDNNANNNSTGSVALATSGTSLIHIEIMLDGWPEEIGWSITDASGAVIDQVSPGEITGDPEAIVEWWVSAPSEGCYTFEIEDTYGDGINGTAWGVNDGYCTVKTYDDNLTYISTVYDYDGSYQYESESAGMAVTSVNTGIQELTLNEVTKIFPNPFSDQTTIQFSLNQALNSSLSVRNLIGQQIMNVDFGSLQAGEHNRILDFSGVNAGVYLISLTAGEEITTMRVTLK